jgi:hypothetical protein
VLSYPSDGLGHDTNLSEVRVSLPKQLPSRLSTLQRACLARTFALNPALCPSESLVGFARAVVPNIPVPLEGPAYFVSNGSEAFPNLIMVLQGYGVTVELVGDTFISKSGITSSTFKSVPDNPVGKFELTLPEGRFSALGANEDLCASTRVSVVRRRVGVRRGGRVVYVVRRVRGRVSNSLLMPVRMVAQDGDVVEETVPVVVTGCSKAKK